MTATESVTPVDAVTAYPSGEAEWMHQRGLGAVLIDWTDPDPSDDHPPLNPRLWAELVRLLHKVPDDQVPAFLTVAYEHDECMVAYDSATGEELGQAARTALVTACRLYEELLAELGTAAALLADLEAGEAG